MMMMMKMMEKSQKTMMKRRVGKGSKTSCKTRYATWQRDTIVPNQLGLIIQEPEADTMISFIGVEEFEFQFDESLSFIAERYGITDHEAQGWTSFTYRFSDELDVLLDSECAIRGRHGTAFGGSRTAECDRSPC